MADSIQNNFITETFDSILGTPSSQRILRLLFCWGQLPVKELVAKSKLRESQVYNTLRNLEIIGLITTLSRGIYAHTDTAFTKKLKEAYLSQHVQLVGKELHHLSSDLDQLSFEELDKRFTMLVELWEPLLNKYYPLKTSSIAGHIIEKA